MGNGTAEKTPEHPEALNPLYSMQGPNIPITLYEGNLRLTTEPGRTAVGRGQIELRWLPTPRIRFALRQSQPLPHPMAPPHVALDIAGLGISCGALLTGVSPGDRVDYRGIVKAPMAIGLKGGSDRVLFHVPNFFPVMGDCVRRGGRNYWRGRLRFGGGEIEITLDKPFAASHLVAELKDQSGFALTHTGVLKTSDGDPIHYDQAEDALSALHWFLSFCRGLWCQPILAVGQVNGEDTWRLWAHPRVTPWKHVDSWFPNDDVFDSVEISKAFDGFITKWSDQLWQSPVKNAIHWYVESNRGAGGVEGSIILTQTALELLGWLYLVEDPTTGKHSNTAFNGMDAHERIRDLLSTLGIPVDIPAELIALHNEAARLGAIDGPHAVVKLRNAIVHPKRTRRTLVQQTPLRAKEEASSLGLWYAEMALLRVFGYEGAYYKRFVHDGADEKRAKVPWT